MKTEELIAALAADHAMRPAPLERACILALVPALLVAAALFLATLGPRADFAAAAETVRFLFKFVVTLSLAGVAFLAAMRLARPGANVRPALLVLALPPLLLAAAVLIELLVTAPGSWTSRLVGSNARICLTSIPALSAAPLGALLLALRRGAPTAPGITGAVAGLVAGGLGAALYASHCTDDSPLFVATWYSLAIAMVAVAGAVLGRRLLRW